MRGYLNIRGWILAIPLLPPLLFGQTTPVDSVLTMNPQPYQRPEKCLPCHQRQYDELRSSVKSGYRNVSPLFNALETAGNLISGGLLRPVYADSTKTLPNGQPFNSNMFTSSPIANVQQMRA